MNTKEYLEFMQKRKSIFILLALCFILGVAYSNIAKRPQYYSESTVYCINSINNKIHIRNPELPSNEIAKLMNFLQSKTISDKVVATIGVDRLMTQNNKGNDKIGQAERSLSQKIFNSMTIKYDLNVLTVGVVWDSPVMASEIVNSLIQCTENAANSMSIPIQFRIIDKAVPSNVVYEPKVALNLLLAFPLSIILSSMIMFVIYCGDKYVK